MNNKRCEQNCQQGCLIERINQGQFDGFDSIERLSQIFGQHDQLHEITGEILAGVDDTFDEEDIEVGHPDEFEESLLASKRADEEGYDETFWAVDSIIVAEFGYPVVWRQRMACAKGLGAHTVQTSIRLYEDGHQQVESAAFPYIPPATSRNKLANRQRG